MARAPSDPISRKADVCAGVLKEARRLVAARVYGPLLHHLVARAYEILAEIDEVLIGLHPDRDHEAFSRVASLHRQLEEIQALVPREHRVSHHRKSSSSLGTGRT